MRLSCPDALRYLTEGNACRRIAEREAATLPGVEPKDLLQSAAVNLIRTLRNRCPGWSECPARKGPGSSTCVVPPPTLPAWGADAGEMYVKRTLRNTSRSLRRPGGAWSEPGGQPLAGDSGPGCAVVPDPERSSLFACRDQDVEDAVLVELYRARLRADVERIAVGEPPAAVWPDVTATRLETKVEAAARVLDGRAHDGRDALRLVDPAYYGDPAAREALTPTQRKRAQRDGAQVDAIWKAVWHRESDR